MPSISKQVGDISEIFIGVYIDQLHKSGKAKQAEILARIFDFQKTGRNVAEFKAFIARDLLEKDSEEISLDDFETHPDFVEASGEFAKINDALRRIRGSTNQEYFNEQLRDKTADSFKYVAEQLIAKGVDADKFREHLKRVKVSTVTTTHPTNPAGVSFTREAMNLAQIVEEFSQAAPSADLEERLRRQIDVVIATPIAEKKKSQAQEVEEGLLYLDAIYDSVPQVYAEFEEAVAGTAYAGSKLPDDVVQPCVWISGDGDGNPNSTEASLRHNISRFQKRIQELYLRDLKKPPLAELVPGIIERFEHGGYTTPQELLSDLQEYSMHVEGEAKKDLTNLIRRVSSFGFHYAKIDVRHESWDLMKATFGLLREINPDGVSPEVGEILARARAIEVSGELQDLKDIAENPAVAQIKELLSAENLQRCFRDETLVASLKDSETAGFHDELTRRIFGRLRAVAETPDMSDKLIIAEFKTPANANAALFLLKASGNEVATSKAKMNIVPLAEEKGTLERLPGDLETVLRDDFLDHIRETKKVYFMIAKSDTVRRDGIGAQEAQEAAVKNSIKSVIKSLLRQGITDLENYEIIPYNGGGHALQRGGGRITEIPSVYGRYALKALRELREDAEITGNETWRAAMERIQISPPCFTVQGHQNYILFHPREVGAGFLSSIASQALYADARLENEVPDNEVESLPGVAMVDAEREDLRRRADEARKLCCETAVTTYQIVKEPKGPINELFEQACWVSTKVNNKSSRASVRGLGDGGIADGTTYAEMKGAGNKLLDQRAIGAEKLCAHSGLHLISWFSIADGLKAVKSSGACSLNEMYRGSKATRDAMRGIATSLFMVDFDQAWRMMFDTDRPDADTINANAVLYREKMAAGVKPKPEETMAFLETQYLESAKLVYETVTGREAAADFKVSHLLEKWQDIKEEIEDREKKCSFAHVMESVITAAINKEPAKVVRPGALKMIEYSYCGSDVTNTPLGILLSLTKDRGRALSAEDHVAGSAAMPQYSTKMHGNFVAMAAKPGVAPGMVAAESLASRSASVAATV